MRIDNLPLDSFGRVYVANPNTMFESKHTYGRNDADEAFYMWNYQESGGAATADVTKSSVRLFTNAGSAAYDANIIKQSRLYCSYSPGDGQEILMTGVLGTKHNSVQKYIGLFDDNNGLYFFQGSGGMAVGVRSDVSCIGYPVDILVYQNSWNVDTLTGSGDIRNQSGKALDFTQRNIYKIKFQWLGVGAVEFGVNLDGQDILCHKMNHANSGTAVYMREATLPVRYQMKNVATLTNTATFDTICAAVHTTGTPRHSGQNWAITNGSSLHAVTVRKPILGIRLANTINGVPNRHHVHLDALNFVNDTKTALFELEHISNVGSLAVSSGTAPTWIDVKSGVSGIQYSTNINSVFGGSSRIISADYVYAATGAGATGTTGENQMKEDEFSFITQNIPANNSEIFVIYATSLSTSTNVGVVAHVTEVN